MSGMTKERAMALEKKMAATARMSGKLFDDVGDLVASQAAALTAFVSMGFRDRLRWLLLGRVK